MDALSAEAFLSLEFLIRMPKHDQAQGTDVLRHVEDLTERPGPVLDGMQAAPDRADVQGTRRQMMTAAAAPAAILA